jgi:hypothetical protein
MLNLFVFSFHCLLEGSQTSLYLLELFLFPLDSRIETINIADQLTSFLTYLIGKDICQLMKRVFQQMVFELKVLKFILQAFILMLQLMVLR